MDRAIEDVLAEYDARAADERKLFAGPPSSLEIERDKLLLRVGPETGSLINLLAKGSGAKSILELGTSYGYSAVWLGEAARHSGGRLQSIDLVAEKQDYARGMLKKAGLDSHVEFIAGDATLILSRLKGPFDFVLVDLWKEFYVPCFDLLYPKLRPGAILVADNMLQPVSARRHANAYRTRVRESSGMESILLPIGAGIEVSRLAPRDEL